MKKGRIVKATALATVLLLMVGCKDLKNKVTEKFGSNKAQVVQVEKGTAPTWSIDNFPNYYALAGKSDIDRSDYPEAGKIEYGELDSLGRTTGAKGSLTFKNVEGSYGVRQKFTKDADPSGWGVQVIERKRYY